MLLVSTTRIIPGRAVPSFLSGRYPAVKVRKKLYVTESRQAILDAFEPLKRRAVKPLREELYEADREAFDKAVLQAFELEDLHNQIRDALSTMVKVRTEGLS